MLQLLYYALLTPYAMIFPASTAAVPWKRTLTGVPTELSYNTTKSSSPTLVHLKDLDDPPIPTNETHRMTRLTSLVRRTPNPPLQTDHRSERYSERAPPFGVKMGDEFDDLHMITDPDHSILHPSPNHRRISGWMASCGHRVDGFMVHYRDAHDATSITTDPWHGSSHGRSESKEVSLKLERGEYITHIHLEQCIFKTRPQICYMAMNTTSTRPEFKYVTCGIPMDPKDRMPWNYYTFGPPGMALLAFRGRAFKEIYSLNAYWIPVKDY